MYIPDFSDNGRFRPQADRSFPDDPDALLRRSLAGDFREHAAEDIILAWIFTLPGETQPPVAARRLLSCLRRPRSIPPSMRQRKLLSLLEQIAAHRFRLQVL